MPQGACAAALGGCLTGYPKGTETPMWPCRVGHTGSSTYPRTPCQDVLGRMLGGLEPIRDLVLH